MKLYEYAVFGALLLHQLVMPIVGQKKCCDAAEEPSCFEGAGCCPDGTWTCSNGMDAALNDLSFTCGGLKLIREQLSEACEVPPPTRTVVAAPTTTTTEGTAVAAMACCDAGTEPLCFEGAGCCPDGTWTCSNGMDADLNDLSFTCGGEKLTRADLSGVCLSEPVRPPQVFLRAPKVCCDTSTEPHDCSTGQSGCCPDGTWTCSNGTDDENAFSTFTCGGRQLVRNQLSAGCA